MSDQEFSQTIGRLLRLLSLERELLMAGRAAEASSLNHEKKELILELNDSAPLAKRSNRREVERVRSLAAGNAALLSGARAGLRRLIERLEPSETEAYVGSYSRRGEKVSFARATGRYAAKG